MYLHPPRVKAEKYSEEEEDLVFQSLEMWSLLIIVGI